MQKYGLPFRNFENLSKRTETTDGIQFRSNHKEAVPSTSRNYRVNNHAKTVIDQSEVVKKTVNQAKTSTKSEKLIEINGHGSTITDIQPGFTTAREYNSLVIDRKRRSSSVDAVEPTRKKPLTNNDGKSKIVNAQNDALKSEKKENLAKEQRVVSGNVGQILKIKKKYPSLNALYEVFANVFKVERSIAGRIIILLRNNTGPILQGIYYEMDVKLIEVKVGDNVRCVGKFVNTSRIHLYKVTLFNDNNRQLVPRLYSLVNFVLQKAPQ